MIEFTDLLDAYLTAKQNLQEARERYFGYDFSYFFHSEIDREEQARAELNAAFNSLTKSTKGANNDQG